MGNEHSLALHAGSGRQVIYVQAADPIDWAKRLPEIRIPTLLIHGEKDVFCDIDTMRYVHSLIPGSKLVVLEGSGHISAMTRPMDVAAAINSYFGEGN